jgi:hypothetical protein
MIASKVVDYINVLNPLPLLAQLQSCLIVTPYYHPPTQQEVRRKQGHLPMCIPQRHPLRAAAPQAWYSASIVDAAAVACFLLDHDTAPPYMVTTQLVVLR